MSEREEVPGTESNAVIAAQADPMPQEERSAWLRGKVNGQFIRLTKADTRVPLFVRTADIGSFSDVFTKGTFTFQHCWVSGQAFGAEPIAERAEDLQSLIAIANAQSAAQSAIDGEWKRIAESLDVVAHELRHHVADLLFAADDNLSEPELRVITRRARSLPTFLREKVRAAVELLQDARRGHVLAKGAAAKDLEECARLTLQAQHAAQDAEARWRDACGVLQAIGLRLGLEHGTSNDEIVKAVAEALARPQPTPPVDNSSSLRKSSSDAWQKHGELMALGDSLLNAMGFSADEFDQASEHGRDDHGAMVKLLSTMPGRLTELREQSERMRGELQHRDSERAELLEQIAGLRQRAENAEREAAQKALSGLLSQTPIVNLVSVDDGQTLYEAVLEELDAMSDRRAQWAASYEEALALLGLQDDGAEIPGSNLPGKMAERIKQRQQEREELVRELGELRQAQSQLRAENVGLAQRRDTAVELVDKVTASLNACDARCQSLIEANECLRGGIRMQRAECDALQQRLSVYEPGEVSP